MNKQLGLSNAPILILVLIAIIAVGAGAYYLGKFQTSQNPPQNLTVNSHTTPIPSDSDQTADWKTYIDTTNGFSFKYPAAWVQRKSSSIPHFEEQTLGPVKKGISVSIYKNVGNLSASQFLDQILYKNLEPTSLKTTYMKNVKFENVKVDGIDTVEFNPQLPTGGAGYIVWLTNNGDGILLASNNVNGGKEILNLILSTFKFTN